MQSVFKAIKLRIMLTRINIVNSWQTETAYFGDAWGNVISTVVYTITYLIFVTVIYANVKTLAGYTRDQMLFLLLLNQLSFYLIYAWSFNNVKNMIENVNRGSFDLLLVKPLPALFYTSTRSLSFLSIIRDGIPALIFIGFAIHWNNIAITLSGLIAGILVIFAGQLALNGFFFLMGLPVFWFGEASNLLAVSYPFTSMDLPYEGVVPSLRLFLTIGIPALVPASLAVSVMLGKTSILLGLTLAITAAILLLALKNYVWKRALINYTSASS